MNTRARTLLFTGDGKGKTTAAIGLAARAGGHGIKVFFLQFIKADATVGELRALGTMNIRVSQSGLGFLPNRADDHWSDHVAVAKAGLAQAQAALAEEYGMVILDEICLAVARGLLEEAEVIAAVQSARPDTCVVLTGRHATAGLIDLADTVTEMRCVKHGLDNGIAAQKGVEM